MHKLYTLALFSALICATSLAQATSSHNHTVTEHAPIGVMGEHAHKSGEWMASYRFGHMHMKGNRDGTSSQTLAQIHTNFVIAPTEMDMNMHMFGLMYGATDELTVMAMVPYVDKSMKHINRMGVRFTTQASGVGDAKLTGLYKLYEDNAATYHDTLLLNAGVSIPTGSVDERDTTPLGYSKLPYPMQLGSGTVDPLLSTTFTRQAGPWSFGAQAGTVLRFGENSENYRLGNEYGLTGWVARVLDNWISASVRLDGKHWGDINGSDPELTPTLVPTARADLRGGSRVDALVGVNLYQPEGTLKGHRLAIEFGAPIYQYLDGPQLETDYRLTVGWQKAF